MKRIPALEWKNIEVAHVAHAAEGMYSIELHRKVYHLKLALEGARASAPPSGLGYVCNASEGYSRGQSRPPTHEQARPMKVIRIKPGKTFDVQLSRYLTVKSKLGFRLTFPQVGANVETSLWQGEILMASLELGDV
jgi:hypothetical protein